MAASTRSRRDSGRKPSKSRRRSPASHRRASTCRSRTPTSMRATRVRSLADRQRRDSRSRRPTATRTPPRGPRAICSVRTRFSCRQTGRCILRSRSRRSLPTGRAHHTHHWWRAISTATGRATIAHSSSTRRRPPTRSSRTEWRECWQRFQRGCVIASRSSLTRSPGATAAREPGRRSSASS